jgi:hypothetical protein
MPSSAAGCREILLVVAGRIWAQLRADRADPAGLAERLAHSWDRVPATGPGPIDHDHVDEANILNRWLYRNAGHPAILPLTRPPTTPDWPTVAAHALGLTDEELARDVVEAEIDAEEAVADQLPTTL